MKKSIFATLGAISCALVVLPVLHCCNTPAESVYGAYVPIEKFEPASEAIDEALSKRTGEESYDLEETIRILNNLEEAQASCTSLDSYLEIFARQDYSRIPEDVLLAKKKLLPIFQKLYLLEGQNDSLKNAWNFISTGLVAGLHTAVDQESSKQESSKDQQSKNKGYIDAAVNILTGIINNVPTKADLINGVVSQASNVCDGVLAEYEKSKELTKKNEAAIRKLKGEYLDYLYEYYPMYLKYYKEWDKLCIEKDKAYIQLYSGQNIDSYNTTSAILEKYPKNREAMLLNAAAAIKIGQSQKIQPSKDITLPELESTETEDAPISYFLKAEQLLDNYIDEYPSMSAPALVLKGMSCMAQGDAEAAMNYYEQSAIEYPRQVEKLNDLMDSYSTRTYLKKSVEGNMLLRYYYSSMEGYGMFSPNFQKALYLQNNGDYDGAAKEIFDHFFRRGHQEMYDCLLSDMEFCEANLYQSLKRALMETSFMNITVSEHTKLMANDELAIVFENNSDMPLRNVRLYICYHLNDMYTNDYLVEPCKTVSVIPAWGSQTWKRQINKKDANSFDGSKIVRIRAILMTDDKVAWVDDLDFRRSELSKKINAILPSGPDANSIIETKTLESFGISSKLMTDELKDGLSVTFQEDSGWNKLQLGKEKHKMTVKIPRRMCLIDPVFCVGEISEGIYPTSQIIKGSNIILEFEFPGEYNEEVPLYILSNTIKYKATIKHEGTTVSSIDVEVL